jgi:hypothetical protein
MKLNWEELSRGLTEGVEKTANLGKLVRPALIGAGVTALGAGAKNLLSRGVNYAQQGMESLAPAVGQFLPSMLNRLGGVSQPHQPGSMNPMININLAKPRTVFDMSQGEVGSLASPNMGTSFADSFKKSAESTKSADMVTEALARAAQMRLANKVIDSVATNPEVRPEESKKIEIVSKYPEMAEMLNKQENKAYLEKLLKE